MTTKTKEEVYIDVFNTEDGYEIYFVGSVRHQARRFQADVCMDSGFFSYEDDLDTFLEENADEITIVNDYRG
jgi:hypothetical protein